MQIKVKICWFSFLKANTEKKGKAEEQKLNLLRETKDTKSSF